MSKYSKFIAAAGGVLALVAAAMTDGVISGDEIRNIVLTAVAAVLVFVLPNKQPEE